MGQTSSSSDDESFNVIPEILKFNLVNNSRELALLTYDDFVQYISKLNQACRNRPDENDKYLLFAVKKGTADSALWKTSVQICCLKVAISGQVESSRCITLHSFLKIRKSILEFLDSDKQPCSSNFGVAHHLHASMVLNKLDDLDPSDLERECSICMERQPDVVLPCAHCYCLPCIEQWNVSHSQCPACRDNFLDTDEAWVVADAPASSEISEYLLSLTEERRF